MGERGEDLQQRTMGRYQTRVPAVRTEPLMVRAPIQRTWHIQCCGGVEHCAVPGQFLMQVLGVLVALGVISSLGIHEVSQATHLVYLTARGTDDIQVNKGLIDTD